MYLYYRLLTLCFVLFLSTQIVYAAPTSINEKRQESLMQQQEQKINAQKASEESQRRSRENMVQLKKETKVLGKIELPEEDPSFYIKELHLRGGYVEKFTWIEEYLRQYENEKIGIQGINLLLKNINEALVNKGYITTRVYVKEQDLSSGLLMVDLSAGTIGQIKFAEQKTWGTFKNAFSVHSGDLLNIRDLEQGLEQMKRVPSQDVDIKIQPTKITGQSDIILTVKRTKSWKIVTSIDDSGSENTGKLQATTALEIDNLFSMNDIFNITYNKDAASDGERRGTRANSFYYSIPFGKQTVSFSKSNYDYHQTVTAAVVPFLSSGKTENFQFSLSHLLSRDQTRKTNFEFNVIKKKRRSFIDDTEITVQRQQTTAMQIGFTHKQYFGQTVLDAALRYQKGVAWFGAKPGPTDGIADQPTTKYNMYLMDINLDTPMKIGSVNGQYNLTIRSQQTKNYLYGSEFFSIGGRYTVRGFDGEQTLSAEKGLIIRNEIRLPISKTSQIYTALDYGKVAGPSTEYLLGKELWGTALGIRGKIKDTQYDVFIGWPVKKPDGFKTPARTYGFQITTQL
ncbi:ShlB/FhaC/HecB family hemolysin secretion/activation protein [Anaerosinus massiliensis]|uniref:ShlB/FhaC/HecB family hemolysin secretion/activation protein n=1 Tax=Massilibacillus massiliensis TaxID=1806837 RepID=UPI000A601518|nr:ShlB/FhaC/HecB family hemolysin secretion/activation protein [Massilibacillus massiliensis]